MFQAGDIVQIVSCERDSRLVGKRGYIIDEAPPFNGLWAVHGLPGFLTANSGGFTANELRKVGHDPRRAPKPKKESKWF
ncbi:hypothetical protein [Streptomyces sp. TLI_185]|uniref:hypothetical protein n=1 Tax=Streptomyces sp. TLI_185 TaxID=2485151 RepID=UPI000FB36212|nr:hypothetical protein [Streptomyces sp. TLI_185]RPF33592.1 hypothetical protein EDD92_3513 [Streptomyces sp. TLI_185]